MKKHVYVAGPMSWGNGVDNVLQGVRAADRLMEAGEIVFLPHLSHFHGLMNDNRWEHADWMKQDKYYVINAKALIRLPGKSRGADQEERWARRHSVPVYYSVQEYLDAES